MKHNTVFWNPWHGCHKISDGCKNCYMFYLDKMRNGGADSNEVKVTKQLNLPIKKRRDGSCFIKSHTEVMTCMTSDFFIEEADEYRDKAWQMMRERSDLLFTIMTKRLHRVHEVLPGFWGDGLENVRVYASVENQEAADKRIPLLMELPFKHRGITMTPMLERIDVTEYLKTGKIDVVYVGGENYAGARPLHFDWVKSVAEQCANTATTFKFYETGEYFVKDGKAYTVKKGLQTSQARKANIDYVGREAHIHLTEKPVQEQATLFD